jgi:hypothetical protein
LVTLAILKSEIVKIKAHFSTWEPSLFIDVSPACCNNIRTVLKMDKAAGFWLDGSDENKSMRRIIVLPNSINERSKTVLQKLYRGLVKVVGKESANSLLVKWTQSSPTAFQPGQQINPSGAKMTKASEGTRQVELHINFIA